MSTVYFSHVCSPILSGNPTDFCALPTFSLLPFPFLLIDFDDAVSIIRASCRVLSDLSAWASSIESLLERLRGMQQPLKICSLLEASECRKIFLSLSNHEICMDIQGGLGPRETLPYLPGGSEGFLVPSHSPQGRVLKIPIFCRSWVNNPLLWYWKQQ